MDQFASLCEFDRVFKWGRRTSPLCRPGDQFVRFEWICCFRYFDRGDALDRSVCRSRFRFLLSLPDVGQSDRREDQFNLASTIVRGSCRFRGDQSDALDRLLDGSVAVDRSVASVDAFN